MKQTDTHGGLRQEKMAKLVTGYYAEAEMVEVLSG